MWFDNPDVRWVWSFSTHENVVASFRINRLHAVIVIKKKSFI